MFMLLFRLVIATFPSACLFTNYPIRCFFMRDWMPQALFPQSLKWNPVKYWPGGYFRVTFPSFNKAPKQACVPCTTLSGVIARIINKSLHYTCNPFGRGSRGCRIFRRGVQFTPQWFSNSAHMSTHCKLFRHSCFPPSLTDWIPCPCPAGREKKTREKKKTASKTERERGGKNGWPRLEI